MFRIILLFLCANNIPSILGSEESDESGLDELEKERFLPENLLHKQVYGCPYDELRLFMYVYGKTHEKRIDMINTFRRKYGEEAYNDLLYRLKDAPMVLTMGINNNTAFYDTKSLTGGDDAKIEVMVSRTPQEMREIKKAYKMYWNTDLCDDIKHKIGDLKDILLALCAADRDESNVVDEQLAWDDCGRIYKYGPTLAGTDEDGINSILFKRNYKQLRRMFEIFSQYIHKTLTNFLIRRSIENVIEEEYSGTAKTALLQYIQAVKNLPEYFASLIKEGLKERQQHRLIRIIFSRAGVDLPEIVEAFGGITKLIEEIEKSAFVTGFTKQALVAILKANTPTLRQNILEAYLK